MAVVEKPKQVSLRHHRDLTAVQDRRLSCTRELLSDAGFDGA
jgi:hypothetical protein